MASYYASFAEGGFALVVTEGIYTDGAFSRSYARQPGLVTEVQVAGWRAVVDALHEAGAYIFAQLMHGGALSQVLAETVGPSAVTPKGEKMPEYGGEGPFPLPREASEDGIREAISGFADAARNAKAAGFDGVEIHGANGYLVDQFITDYTNTRSDRYGGPAADRARFACEVIEAVRGAVGGNFPVGIRLSQGKVNDHGYWWPGGRADAEAIFGAIGEAEPDYLHVASEGRDWRETARIDAGVTITQLAKGITGLPVVTNGGMHDPELAGAVLREGHGDLVALGRGALANPDWPNRLREGRPFDDFEYAMIKPAATIGNTAAFLARRGGANGAGGTW
jgi:2,4-dienoyl-CoA reductase-like NADH-dependent reductase (Old Yellow Enzyme family)